MNQVRELGVWFPTVRTGTGTDVFTERLAAGLAGHGIRAEITWLPLRAEYAPWAVPVPKPAAWATVAHVNTWLPPRFLPDHLPVVATIHHSVHHPDVRAYKGFARAAYHRFWIAPNERRVLRRASRIIAVSRFVAETAKQILLDVPMEVIYNGVDTERFRPSNRQRQPGESFRLLYVGSWMARKGVDLLAPIMHDLGDGFELHYTGGPAAEKDKPEMPANMHDLGRLHGEGAVIEAMRDADALLFPSRCEGHPLVVIEAMACGLPPIAARGSSLAEAVTHEESGLLCEMDSIADFVKVCRRLQADSELHCRMRRTARACAVKSYSVEYMADAYTGLYSPAAGC